MKKIKKMLLKIAGEKGIFFITSFLIAVVVSLLAVFLITIFEYDNGVLIASLITIWSLFLVFITVVYLTIAAKITSFRKKENRVILLHHLNEKSTIYSHPFWGKVPFTKIYLQDVWEKAIKNSEKKEFYFFWEIILEMKDLDNGIIKVSALIPIIWSFLFKDFFTISDLEKISKNGGEKFVKEVELETYLENLFLSINNKSEIEQKVKEAALLWHQRKITGIHLKKIIENNVFFPKNIFSNTILEQAEIRLAHENHKLIFIDSAYNL